MKRSDPTLTLPIYEIGEHQGRHCFSIGLIEGPNLREALRNRSSRREEAPISPLIYGPGITRKNWRRLLVIGMSIETGGAKVGLMVCRSVQFTRLKEDWSLK